ncbi:MAG: hypothetical protein ACC628_00640, partial [Pirellulaceae bacterium]
MASVPKTPKSHSELPGSRTTAEPPDRVIERQLRRTRRQVKLIDLATAMMTLAAGVLAYVLLLVVIDHWLMGLSYWGRFLALLALLGGMGWYTVSYLVPPLLRAINPVYAARAIEESQPSLKNSLVNFLLLRDKGGAVHRIVFEAMRHRAASDLNRISVDTAVDRSRLIHVGYVLAGVLVLCGLYVILSPKDAFQTVSRVAAPWAEIARPARVEIADVVPGDDEVFQGQNVAVSAEVRGIASDDEVVLLFSSSDGQLVGQAIPMQITDGGLRYACSLPPGDAGIQQDLAYQIRAGDAITGEFWLRVSPAPTILVERVEYAYPAYTGRPPRVVERDGDIVALEGTRVTVRARANYGIRSASLEFDPPSESSPDVPPRTSGNRLPMEHEGTAAWRTFTLELPSDRRVQQHTCYQLAFQTENGHPSEHPILYRIRITPDLGPEIQILTPTKQRIEVPEDGMQRIEIRAVDPDFGLSRVGLRAVAGGSDLIDEPLLDRSQQGRTGQVIVEYAFRPADLRLVAGDEVVYWAVAEDNRTAPSSDLPEPNAERTRNYHIVITPARHRDAEPSSTDANSESPKPENQNDDARSESQEGGTGQGGTAGAEEGSASDSENMDPSGGEQGTSGQSGDSGSASHETEGSEQEGEPNGSGTEQGQDPSDGTSDGQPSRPGASSEGTSSETGEISGSESSEERLHDGEVFERALQQMKEQQEQAAGNSQKNDPANGNRETPADGDMGTEATPQQPQPGNRAADGEAGQNDDGPQQEGGSDGQMQHPSSKPSEGGTAGREKEPPAGEPPSGAKPKPGRQKQTNGPDSAAGQQSPKEGSSEPDAGRQMQHPSDGSGSNRPSPQDRPEPTEPNGGPESTDDPSTPSQGEKPSGSQGESSGDPTGGSPQGPGQNASEPGQDHAGNQSSSDQESAGAPEAGDSEPSSAPGQSQSAEKPAGGGGKEQGPGSSSQEDPSGNRTGAGTRKPPLGEESGQQPPPPDGTQKPGSSPGNGTGPVTGGGLPSETEPSIRNNPEDVADGDEPRLDYARRVTDMVLEYLKDQQDDPDQRLLEELGWTPEEMRIFLDRWMRLKRAAERDNAAQFELDETLRGLGLRPPRDHVRQNRGRNDDVRGMTESGSSTSIPEQYRDQI